MMLRKIFKGSRNEDITGSTATLFVSHANLSDSGGTRLLRQESIVRNTNKAIVKDLLENFDMEETKKKYMESKIVEIVWDSNDFSFDSALSTAKVRARLHQLMGTDVIRLNDKNYTNKMVRKLEEERKADVIRKEQALAEAEQQRLRKLQLNGILPKEKDGAYRKNKVSNTKQENQKRPVVKSKVNEEEEKDVTNDDDYESSNDDEVTTQMDRMNDERDSDRKTETKKENSGANKSRREYKTVRDKEKEIKHEVMLKDAKPEEQTPVENTNCDPKKVKKENSFVRELNSAETVNGLYNTAERLLGVRNE